MAVVGRDMLLRLDTSNANDRNHELMINNEKTNDDLPVDEMGPPSGAAWDDHCSMSLRT